MRFLILIIAVVTLLTGLLMAFAGPLSQTGIISWRTAFRIMQVGAQPLVAGVGLSLLGLIITVLRKMRSTLLPTIGAVGVGTIVIVTLMNMRSSAGAHPIHDITTDFENPPAIVAAANVERSNPASYEKTKPYLDTGISLPQWQRELYPDIDAQYFEREKSVVFAAAKSVAEVMGWTILANDAETGMIEAVYKSTWFGFSDDIVVRVSQDSNRVRVDMRSKSRVGASDLGANANRIRAYQAKLEEALQEAS